MSNFLNSIGRLGRGQNRKQKPGSGTSSGNGSTISLQSGSSQQFSITAQSAGRQTMRPLFLCQPFVKASLLKGSFKTIVVLPKYVDEGEWLALNIFEFYEHLNRFCQVVSEFCTIKSCPSMSAGPGLDYLWLTNKQPTRIPAPEYIEYVMTWIRNTLNNESLFPTKTQPTTTSQINTPSITTPGATPPTPSKDAGNWIGKDTGFPPQMFHTCKAIYKQMFRIFAHIYHTHFDKIVHLSLEAHFNSFFAHFIHFGREFDLLEEKDMGPLKELIDAFDAQVAQNNSKPSGQT